MFVHIPQNHHVSKNARQLSDQFVEVIRAAKKQDKKLTYMEVFQATQLANQKVREELGGMAGRLQLWIAMGVLVAIAVGAAAFAAIYR